MSNADGSPNVGGDAATGAVKPNMKFPKRIMVVVLNNWVWLII
jgi:hypothetical protein